MRQWPRSEVDRLSAGAPSQDSWPALSCGGDRMEEDDESRERFLEQWPAV